MEETLYYTSKVIENVFKNKELFRCYDSILYSYRVPAFYQVFFKDTISRKEELPFK